MSESEGASRRKLLTAEEIFSIDDLGSEVVEVEEWGGSVRIRGMSADERQEYLRRVLSDDADIASVQAGKVSLERWVGIGPWLVSRCVIDANGNRVFSDEDEVLKRLGGKAPRPLQRIAQAITRLSKMDEEGVERARGESEASPSGGSSTGSA